MSQDIPEALLAGPMGDPILQCLQLHKHETNDTNEGRTPQDTATVTGRFVFKHRHIHLALKYTRRLRTEQDACRQETQRHVGSRAKHGGAFTAHHKSYLEQLVASFRKRIRIPVRGGSLFDWPGVTCAFWPRVVGDGGEARFLLLTVYPSLRGPQHSYRGPAFEMSVCAHHAICYNAAGATALGHLAPIFITTEDYHYPYAIKYGREDGASQWEVHTSCARCSTDIVYRDDAWYVYQELGSEDVASCDVRWQVFRQDGLAGAENGAVWHGAGTVQRRYNEDVESEMAC